MTNFSKLKSDSVYYYTLNKKPFAVVQVLKKYNNEWIIANVIYVLSKSIMLNAEITAKRWNDDTFFYNKFEPLDDIMTRKKIIAFLFEKEISIEI